MKITFEKFGVTTEHNNLSAWDPNLKEFFKDEFFYVKDLTDFLKEMVFKSGIQNGALIVQALHTTCVLSVNELNEPMLLGDICRRMEKQAPKIDDYLHNSKLRTVNLCADDYKCDRNADAHIKSFLIGNHSTTLLVEGGQLLLGKWQRVALIDFDGPRERNLVVQILGE